MDILIQNGKAHELFPNGAPELHPSLVIVRDYVGDVETGWDWDGTTFTVPAVEPTPPPFEVSMRQARLQLLADGNLATIESAMASASDAAKIEWEYATVVRRDSDLTIAMAAVLGLSEADLDAMFESASLL